MTTELMAQMRQMHDLMVQCNPMNHGLSIHKLVIDHGLDFEPRLRPPGYRKMTDKECFSNSARLVLSDESLTYVEGFALLEFAPIAVHHAWILDADGKMIDPTWHSAGSAYRGIPFKTEYLELVMQESGMYGILDNYQWRGIFTDDPEEYLRKEHHGNHVHQEAANRIEA